jgi:hypothetical protein
MPTLPANLNVGFPEQYGRVYQPAGTGATAPVEEVIGAVQHAGQHELLNGGAHIVTFRNNLNKAGVCWRHMQYHLMNVTLCRL